VNTIPKRYEAMNVEPKWQQYWEDKRVNSFQPRKGRIVYSIDTPPPTVSGNLHMGHCYSYSQTDFYARFWRMNGRAVFYPMGWDDNGLPTERLVEKRLGITPEKVGAEAFLQAIGQTSKQLEEKYEKLWRRLGLSVNWRYTYSTISPAARKIAQHSFLDLYQKEDVYLSSSPTIWCSFCKTAIAHAEVTDMLRQAEFVTIAFSLEDGQTLPIATTRPELLPACVAIFVNQDDKRYRHLIDQKAKTPLFGKEVPILSDPKADPGKGTGIVMCCTFGDATDIKWWREHALPLINIIGHDGKLNQNSGFLTDLDIKAARKKIIEELSNQGLILDKKAASQTVSVHERCETPIEYIETKQWFINVLDRKEMLLEAGRKINWHPAHMLSRYEDWVQNLEWDWCISRQRYHGVPFPLWYCLKCGEVLPAEFSELPIDPRTQNPSRPCKCGSEEFTPETSVMDTWMTSSMSPQIAGGWLNQTKLFNQVFPMSLRPQAYDIIRTWTFYTVVKSLYHFDKFPWSDIAISGHGLSPEGHKVSKSKGGNILDPIKVMEKYSADTIRYWAASTKLGEDSLISEDKIAAGQKLINKLWNVASFAFPFLKVYRPSESIPCLVPVDKWVLSRLQSLIIEATESFKQYDHASGKIKVEAYFWDIIADNYLEMVKTRLYDLEDGAPEKESAKFTLYQAILTLLKLLAPITPYVTEEIFQLCFKRHEVAESVHLTYWPEVNGELIDPNAEILGEALVEIATAARRYKSEHQLPMGTPLDRIKIALSQSELLQQLEASITDIKSVTRGKNIELGEETPGFDTPEQRLSVHID